MSDKQSIITFTEAEKSLLIEQEKPSEDLGTLTPELLELAYRKKLYHLAVPKELGGAELSVKSLMQVFETASFYNGSFGWNLTLGAGAGIFGAYMEPAFAQKVFSDRKAFITGSGYPSGKAQPVRSDNSFLIHGDWKYASGSPHATLFTANCQVNLDDSDEPEVRAFAFYPDEVNLINSWNSYGLIATASHDFEIRDIRVPKNRSFTMSPQPEYASRPLYRFPFMPFAVATLASSLLGMTHAFFDEAGSHTKVSSEITSLMDEVEHTRNHLNKAVDQIWEECQSGSEISSASSEYVTTSAKNLAGACKKAAFALYQRSGMRVLDRDSRFNRTWRDLLTAGQHVMFR